jgi:hypothetical protein
MRTSFPTYLLMFQHQNVRERNMKIVWQSAPHTSFSTSNASWHIDMLVSPRTASSCAIKIARNSLQNDRSDSFKGGLSHSRRSERAYAIPQALRADGGTSENSVKTCLSNVITQKLHVRTHEIALHEQTDTNQRT